MFSKLSFNKVLEVYEVINKLGIKGKPKFNITTKNPFYKQIIILMDMNNTGRIIIQASKHIENINRLLKSIKSEIVIDYIQSDKKDIIITTNKVVVSSNLNMVEKYIKNLNYIDLSNIMSPRLPQSKYYLKILGIPYFVKDTNFPIISNIIERVIQSNYIFNNLILTSHPQVIKTSLKSNMVVIWIDIWDLQNSLKAKCLINRCFNVGHYIITIKEININPGVLQYKNCWK